MKQYSEMTRQELEAEKIELYSRYESYKSQGLKLNIARGLPSAEQIEISMPLVDILSQHDDYVDENGADCRNYGGLQGISSARKLFGEYMGVSEDEIIIAGSSSLTLMYDFLSRAMLKGVLGSGKPWGEYEKIKFICPVPGYDRHFAMCEFLGIEMINVPMLADGPDMDMVEKIVAEDESVKGMWITPKFSNPMGAVISDEKTDRLASMKTAAEDFRIFWDDAYEVHYIYKDVPLKNLLKACKEAGHPDRAYMFGSTSKITIPGDGVCFFAASEANIQFTLRQLKAQAISWDKVNMLRQVRFLKDMDTIHAIMGKHAELLRPKFDAILGVLERELRGRGAGDWTRPDGGYFVMFIAEKGCAARIVELCSDMGVLTTDAGATHPYHKDPDDAFIRLAPSYAKVGDIVKAGEIISIAARTATVEKYLKESI